MTGPIAAIFMRSVHLGRQVLYSAPGDRGRIWYTASPLRRCLCGAFHVTALVFRALGLSGILLVFWRSSR